MRTIILLAAALLVFSCSRERAAESPARLSSQALTQCWNPPGLCVMGTFADHAAADAAQAIVDKMMGYPRAGHCVSAPSTCGTIPATCTVADCNAGLCYGWSCHYAPLYQAADDGVRVGTQVMGLVPIDNAFALEPGNKLTQQEHDDLAAARSAAVTFDNYMCWDDG